ncbi:hypothetical protein GQ53DRAFT_707023 [Thozetella sp. PMI_491]|nr:hypothetical protein GQ53DRAFT_707023 [Thozetella sp. PMI_491]
MENEEIWGTEGEDPRGTPPPRPTRITKPADRSCMVCHRRKVRCDRKLPCSVCTKTGVLCCYPSSDKPVQRHPRTTIADISARLGQLERTLVAVAESGSASKPAQDVPSPGLERESTPKNATGDSQPVDEALVTGGYSSHYVNDTLLSRVIEEEKDIRSLLAAQGEAAAETLSSAPSISLLSLAYAPGSQLRSVAEEPPSTWQCMQLWQAFLQNVDPSVRVLHIPSSQVTLFTAIGQKDSWAPEVSCLLNSIFFSAAISLTPEEIQGMLKRDKAVALAQFKLGLERSLVQANFFEKPTLMVLEAVVLFLRTARAHNTGRSMWLLWGLIMRAAMSIGLHRDGADFPLSPFEVERRRRIWWQMVTQDLRAAEDHGITILSGEIAATTRLPLNVNDSDLEPDMRELPPSRQEWTDMSLPLLMEETTRMSQALARLLASSEGVPDEEKRAELVQQHSDRAEALLRTCDTVIPHRRMAAACVRLRIRKLDLTSRIQSMRAGSRPHGTAAALATEENLLDACEIVETGIGIQRDDMLRSFRWAGDMYPQFHAILYILWHLTVRPSGGSADRAWALAESAFEQQKGREQRQVINKTSSLMGEKWTLLATLRDKAKRRRELAKSGVGAAEAVPTSQGSSDTTPLSEIMDGITMANDSLWEGGYLDLDALAGDFPLDATYDFSIV